LTKNRTTAVSAFQMYEIHTTQEGTQINPGQAWNLDYSVTHVLSVQQDLQLQIGMIGHEQRQTTDKTGPGVTASVASTRYKINAIGFASSVI
jgi:hypothetical protein